ncbi:MAG: tetratricopeptide repeat protein, partial [Acidobacteriaceae bacterium]|nr:tetratricopeptide repeat protein [Acidobacteriaceae bacterium]
ALCQTEDASTDSKQAVEDCTRALTGLKPSGSKLDIFSAEMHLGAAYEALGDRSQALQAYEDAVVATQTAGDTAMQSTAYLKIGTLHFNAGEWQPAIKADTQALEIARARADAPGQVAALMALSSCYQSIGNFKKSLDYSLQALRLNKNETSELKRETVLMSVGDSYNWLGETQKALDYLNQALILAEKYPEQKGLLLAEVGEIYSAIGDQKTALEKEQQAFDLYHSVSNPGGEAKALNDMGLIYAALGEEPQARDSYQKALVIQRERKNVGAQSTLLMNLGDLAQYFGNGKDAEKLYSDSLTLSRQIGLRSQEADALTKLGMVYHALGDEPKALETLNQALAIYRETENRHGEAFALGDLAVFYSDTGNPQRSLESLGHVLAIYRELGDPPNEATTLDNLGSAYQTLGDYDQAQQYVQQALEIRERIHEESGQSVSLNDLAVLAQLRKDTPAALRYFDQSLALAKKTGNKLGQSRLLANEGAIYSEQGNQQRALDIFELSLKLAHEVDYLDSEAQALHNRGRAKFDSGDARGALEDYRQALALWRQLNRVDGEAQTSSAAARAERKLGNLDAALRDVNESIRLSESARGRIASKTLRASYLATVANYYELAIDLLIQLDRLHPGQGYDAQALEMSEQSRARSLLDLLTQAHADNIRAGVDPGLVSEERAIENSIKAKNTERAKLLDAFSRTADTSAQAQHLELEIENLIAEYQHLEDRIKASNPAYAALTDPEPLKVKQIQQLLDPDTLLLEYSLGKDRSFLWLVTQNSFTAHELPKREEIEEQAGNYHYLLTNKIPNPTALRKAEQYLSSVLLGPVAPQLDGKRLVFVADGMLQEIPFAALPSPLDTGLPLVAEHEIVSEPSASALAVLRRETTGRTLAPKIAAVLADPVFEPTDERLTGASAKQDPSVNRAVLNAAAQQSGLRGADNIKRLPYTRQEAAEILKISPPDQSIALLDFKATKSFVQTADLTQYRIVHFATHGLLDSQHPELSGLVLSRFDEKGQPLDGFLALEDIFNLKLPAQLVVLSACQSGEGKLIGGEGLVGLTRGFMYAGASTLNVSLWNVDDAATAQLMAHFYGGLLGSQHLKPAAALRTAQLALMKHNEWKHPYFWAPFVIQGEWR